MDHIPLRLHSFKLHLAIPMKRRARLPKNITLIYLPRINETLLEINGATIPPNKPAPIILRRVHWARVADESEVVYESTDHVCIGDRFGFEIYIRGEKAFKGVFRQEERWGLECEVIGFMICAEVSVVADRGFLMRKRVKLGKAKFCPKLLTIPEEGDEEENANEASNDLNYKENIEEDDEDGAMKKGISWAVNVGNFVACLGVGLFVSRATFRRLVGLNML